MIVSNREIVGQKDVDKIISGFIQTYSGIICTTVQVLS